MIGAKRTRRRMRRRGPVKRSGRVSFRSARPRYYRTRPAKEAMLSAEGQALREARKGVAGYEGRLPPTREDPQLERDLWESARVRSRYRGKRLNRKLPTWVSRKQRIKLAEQIAQATAQLGDKPEEYHKRVQELVKGLVRRSSRRRL